MTVPGWAVGVIATLFIASVAALVQLSFFLGGVLRGMNEMGASIRGLKEELADGGENGIVRRRELQMLKARADEEHTRMDSRTDDLDETVTDHTRALIEHGAAIAALKEG